MIALLRYCLLAALLLAAPAWAHKPSDSYLTLDVKQNGQVDGQWDIALRDLEMAIGLDQDGNGE
ncbi:MAG TPA: HupE/UreJ family protein, partial [Ramlibacter sp.]